MIQTFTFCDGVMCIYSVETIKVMWDFEKNKSDDCGAIQTNLIDNDDDRRDFLCRDPLRNVTEK